MLCWSYFIYAFSSNPVTSLLFIKARPLNPTSRNVYNIPLPSNHIDKRYETYQLINNPSPDYQSYK